MYNTVGYHSTIKPAIVMRFPPTDASFPDDEPYALTAPPVLYCLSPIPPAPP